MKKIVGFMLVFFAISAAAQPQFKGGKEGLEAYLKSNIVYPLYSLQNCIQGTVNISFKLDHQGKVYYSVVQKGLGTDLDDEALRLIRTSNGKWKVPPGFDTTTAIVVPVNFSLKDYNCEGKDKADIRGAINAYRAKAGLTDAILNFYRNQEQGKSQQLDEARIIALKEQLGYDTRFLNRKLKSALAKLRQGDKQGACEDFLFIKHMGSEIADNHLKKYCN